MFIGHSPCPFFKIISQLDDGAIFFFLPLWIALFAMVMLE
jgi:hypothetical protein